MDAEEDKQLVDLMRPTLEKRVAEALNTPPTESDWRKLFEPEIRPCPTCKRGGRMPLVFSLDYLARAEPASFAARAEDGKTSSRTRECPTCDGKGVVEIQQDWCRALGWRKFLPTPLVGMSGLRQCLVQAPQRDEEESCGSKSST